MDYLRGKCKTCRATAAFCVFFLIVDFEFILNVFYFVFYFKQSCYAVCTIKKT